MTRRLSASRQSPVTGNQFRIASELVWQRTVGRLTGLVLICSLTAGCISKDRGSILDVDDSQHYQSFANQTYYPSSADWGDFELQESAEPLTIDDATSARFKEPTAYRDMTLPEVIQEAFAHSTILRELGGTILRNPDGIVTTYSIGITETDPRFGIEAALSDFDTEFSTNAFFEKNDRQVNNQFFGGGIRTIEQDINDYQAQLSKTAATGTQMFLRSNTNYDANNAPANAFGSAWTTNLEGEVRHPLLQGAGLDFNRIAGPNAVPGAIGGVVIAQTNADISSEDFAIGLRDYISNVENAYWDLYYAYRDLDAKLAARDYSLKVWQEVKVQLGQRRGAELDEEALASEQYYRLQEEVENALTGRQLDGTRTRNGASGGAFRNTGGVHRAERRLRYLMGITINDGHLIRPTTEPEMAEIAFDWRTVVTEALAHRSELKRQRIRVRQRELQLQASKNFLAPRLDAVGRYRWRGFGKDFIDTEGTTAEFDNALEDLAGGKFQEWQLGFEFNIPIGFRRAWAAVQNSELLLAKERALMREQERQIVHDLSDAIAELKRAYRVAQTNLNRYKAAQRLLNVLQENRKIGRPVELDKLLDAQNRVTAAQARYFLSRTEYHIAIKNVNFEKGTLLEYNGLLVGNASMPQTVNAASPSAPASKPELNIDELVAYGADDQKQQPVTQKEQKPIPPPAKQPIAFETNQKSNVAETKTRAIQPVTQQDKKPIDPKVNQPIVLETNQKSNVAKVKSRRVGQPATTQNESKNPKVKAKSPILLPAEFESEQSKVESLDPFIHETEAKSDIKKAPQRKKIKLLPFEFRAAGKQEPAKSTKQDKPARKLLP